MIYAIQAGTNGPIKIGFAAEPKQRIKTLQTGNHETLNVFITFEGDLKTEKQIHSDLKKYCLRKDSKEWFIPNDNVINYLLKHHSSNPDTETIDGVEYIVLWRPTEEAATEPCPFCGEKHMHGQGDGHRVPHCSRGLDVFIRQKDNKEFKRVNGYMVKTQNGT